MAFIDPLESPWHEHCYLGSRGAPVPRCSGHRLTPPTAEVSMRSRYVWLICAIAIVIVEVLRALALRSHSVSADALESSRHLLYVVAGIGAGRLAAAGRLRRAIWAGVQAGGIMGLVACSASEALARVLHLGPAGAPVRSLATLSVWCAVTIATAATLGGLGGIAGWGIRRAVEPAA
jgi:hypothetical protein